MTTEADRMRASLAKLVRWVEVDHPKLHYENPRIPCGGPGKCQTLIDLVEARRLVGRSR